MPEINGGTRLLAVIGHPIEHSLSPRIHAAFIEEARLNYAYVAFDVEPCGLGAFMQAARCLNIAGFNVTMPLKEVILPHIDVLDAVAARCGAVNTVAMRGGVACGYNTDGEGFINALRHAGLRARHGSALILGAGGAAKTVALALADAGAHVCVAARRPLDASLERAGITYCPWEGIADAAGACSLLVNATPLGMSGHAQDFTDLSFVQALPKNALVCDLIYAPGETALLKAARRAGLDAANGLGHLVCQAALSFYHFTGVKAGDGCVRALIDAL